MKDSVGAVMLRVCIAALCITFASCASLLPPRLNVDKAVLDQMPTDLPRRESCGATLLVYPPQATPIYDTIQMAYRVHAHEVGYFREREWAATPPQMLHPLLVKTMESTYAFCAVLIPSYSGRYTYALRTEILELIQDFTSESAVLVLSVRFQLTDYATSHVIATKDSSLHEPMQQRSSYAGVAAANDATAKALQELAAFVLDKTD